MKYVLAPLALLALALSASACPPAAAFGFGYAARAYYVAPVAVLPAPVAYAAPCPLAAPEAFAPSYAPTAFAAPAYGYAGFTGYGFSRQYVPYAVRFVRGTDFHRGLRGHVGAARFDAGPRREVVKTRTVIRRS